MSKHKPPKRTLPAQTERSTRTEQKGSADRKTRAERSVQRTPAAKPERKYTLPDCMKLGFYANLLFVVFIVISLIYYYSLAKFGRFFIPFEIFAFTVETMGFVLFIVSVFWMDSLVRGRTLLKILMPIYISIEVLLMLLEFDLLPFIPYNGLSLTLIIVHAIGSGAIAFSLLQLDPTNKHVERIVTITVSIILAGMLPGIANYRVYASVLINAFAYIFFFVAMHRKLVLEEVEVDCHGDAARVTEFSTTMFTDSPLLQEQPEKKRKTVKELAKSAADRLTGEETTVLTDKDDKFEYEFGVQEDDEDDEDDEYDDDDYDDYDEDEDDDNNGGAGK